MNRVETFLVTSPANRAFQRRVEAPTLRRLGGRTPGAHALEIGCGSGYGTKLIIDQFGAATVDTLDLDPPWSTEPVAGCAGTPTRSASRRAAPTT